MLEAMLFPILRLEKGARAGQQWRIFWDLGVRCQVSVFRCQDLKPLSWRENRRTINARGQIDNKVSI